MIKIQNHYWCSKKNWKNEINIEVEKVQERMKNIFFKSLWSIQHDPIDHIAWQSDIIPKAEWSNNYFWLDAELYDFFIITSNINTEQYINTQERQRYQKNAENYYIKK